MTQAHAKGTSDADVNRYEIEKKLGAGHAGAVYLARDRETGEHVALKKLFRMDARSVLRLKREFRALVDVAHPNLVKLYDMGRADEAWFMTMEYVEGVDLTTYLTNAARASNDNGIGNGQNDREHRQRLAAMQQLAQGVHALHQAGMLHRDLKPSNVLVEDGRIVVLDFGLAREIDRDAAMVTEDGSVAGTPAYMAPEQLLGAELSAAADWYAYGVIMYEAFSGLLPIEGSLVEILRHKLERDPEPLSAVANGVPPQIAALCMALLQRDPAKRPRGDDVLAALEVGPIVSQRTSHQNVSRTATDVSQSGETQGSGNAALPIVGRSAELAYLWKALSEIESSTSTVVHVRGASGSGKTALIERFLDDVATQRRGNDVLVVRSRCHELEQMPFKALDGVVDALANHLSQLDDVDGAHMLPHEVGSLARLFPVLERVRVVKRLTSKRDLSRDALTDRQRAERAMRELLVRMADYRPIVLFIDDLQWGDLDSAHILSNFIAQTPEARILFVFSYRSDEVTTSSCLSRLLDAEAGGDHDARRTREYTLDVKPLADADIAQLCEELLGTQLARHPELVQGIVREAHGSPFLALQLATLAQTKLASGHTDLQLSIDALVAQTNLLLPEEAKQLLTVLAVAGRPMSTKCALRAAGIRRNGRAVVHALRGLNLVRSREVARQRMLEVYHFRVRQSVRALLTPAENRRVQGELFDALEFSGEADMDWLHSLALAAGRNDAARQYGMVAAERANAALAFERAADLYERCIALSDPAHTRGLWVNLAVAHMRCGRGAAAAEAYLEAAKLASGREAVALMQAAASQLLRCGRFEQGDALVRQVHERMGISMPRSDAALIAAILWENARIKLRGFGFELRSADEVPAELLAKHDLFDTLGTATLTHDPLRGALFQARALRCALDAGEPRRLTRSLCRSSLVIATLGTTRARREAEALLDRAEPLAAALSDQDTGFVRFTRATNAFLVGDMHGALAHAHDAAHALQRDTGDDPEGSYYRRSMLGALQVGARFYLGDFKLAQEELRALLAEADATDNRSMRLQLTLVRTVADLANDRIRNSRQRLDEEASELPAGKFGVLHALHMIAVMFTACSTHEFDWARAHLKMSWPRYQRSVQSGAGYMPLTAHTTRARMLLNEFVVTGGARDIKRELDRETRALAANPMRWTSGRVLARRAYLLDGDRARAERIMQACIDEDRARRAPIELARDEYALASLRGHEQGRQAALRSVEELGVVNAGADLGAYFPELLTRSEHER